MFTHICIGANDLEASAKFYDAALAPLGVAKGEKRGDRVVLYASGENRLLLITPADGQPASFGNGATFGFKAANTEAVDAFHAAGIAAGGADEGAPGPRPNAPGNAYGAYLRDPVGNKICAFAQLG